MMERSSSRPAVRRCHPLRPSVVCLAVLFLSLTSLSHDVSALTFEAAKASIRTAGDVAEGGWNLYSNGTVGEYLRFRTRGTYVVIVRARGTGLGGVAPVMGLSVDGLSRQTVDVGSRSFRDYRFRVGLGPGVCMVGASFLNDASDETEDRNLYVERIEIRPLAGSPDPVLSNEREWATAARAREDAALRSTREAIRKNRMGTATITVLDGRGKPIPGAEVAVEQKRHDFLFGSNIFMFDRFRTEAENERYKARFTEVFNYATLPFFWKWLDPAYCYTDKLVAWCTHNGIRMKGHPLLWQTGDGKSPSGDDMRPEAQKRHVEEVMKRYDGAIEFWEVVNEPSHLTGIPLDGPYRWAREASPGARLVINDYGALSDLNPPFFNLLKEAALTGVPFDGIGIQAHEPVGMAFPLDRVQAVLDSYGALGKAIQITELAFPSNGTGVIGSPWRGSWNEAVQAGYVDGFYRVCFAHPAVEAVTWWDLSDRGSWLKGGGLLRADLTPKPAYEALKRLIKNEWWTAVEGRTDERGAFRFSGFFGSYTARLRTADAVETIEFRLVRGGENSLDHRMAAGEGLQKNAGELTAPNEKTLLP